jgi:DNA-directed RNA polymerase subunit E'/Rpb7
LILGELEVRNNKIALLRQKDAKDKRFNRSQEEAERLILEETKVRIQAEKNVKLRLEETNLTKRLFEEYKQ